MTTKMEEFSNSSGLGDKGSTSVPLRILIETKGYVLVLTIVGDIFYVLFGGEYNTS